MRRRLPLAAAAAWLLAVPAAADVVTASSTTVVTAGRPYRDGSLTSAVPVYELVSISASEMKTSWGEFEATLSAWGAVDGSDIRFWQNGAPVGSRATGDVDVAYLRGDLRSRKLTVRLGRQVIVEGNARMLHLDGAQIVVRPSRGFGLSLYGGAPVAPRFDARGTAFTTGNTLATVAYGGRAYWSLAGLLELGVSGSMATADGDLTRKDVGADLRITPHHRVEITSSGFYNLPEKRVGQVDVAVGFEAQRTLRLAVDYQHVEPDLFLPRNSILSVFAADKRNDFGGGLRWTPMRTIAVDADYHLLKAEDGNGSRARLKGTYRPYGRWVVGADFQLLKVPENGYWLARAFASRELGRFAATLDGWFYRYDKQVNGQDQSLGGTVTGSMQLAPSWRVALAGTAGSDPFYKSRLDVMAKLVWNQLYTREVR
ncbi:MAG: hypothetical protein HZB56_22275 [Deltaproteobacteria bacterium]|nr:hypothetical protein [Deltaproteobacteria bacterium]